MLGAILLVSLQANPSVQAADQQASSPFGGVTPLEWSVRMADSEIARRGDSLVWREGGKAKWDYTVGLFTLSLLRLNERAASTAYVDFPKAVIGSFITSDGQIRGYRLEDYNLDNIAPGRTVLALYRLTREERYQKAAALLRGQLNSHPRTSEGGFWHKQRYPHQMWLDGLYMGSPFYAEYGRLFNEPAAFDDVAKQIRLVAAHTYDPATGLFYHGWDESKEQPWANKTTGTSPNFWGRAIGWYAMALVDTLDVLPADHPARPEITGVLQRLCSGVLKHQDPGTGLWYQVVDQGTRQGNYLEATASAMFVYSMAKGVNRRVLSRDIAPAVVKGYTGITARLIKTDPGGRISLTQCCSVAGLGYGRDGSTEYYLKEPVVENDLKGIGPFILAGIEMQDLFSSAPESFSVVAPHRPRIQ
jgi:unsaturated rhamnogalacturonyl hydrolase